MAMKRFMTIPPGDPGGAREAPYSWITAKRHGVFAAERLAQGGPARRA
jgi:hypothetical protein